MKMTPFISRKFFFENFIAAPRRHEGFGLIQVFTGNGKGKTTAALGEAVRAFGAGRSVGIVYFDKGGDHYSERAFLQFLSLQPISDNLPPVSFIATGRDRMDLSTGRFDFSITDSDRTEAERGLRAVQDFFDEGRDVVILDEINSTVSLGMLDEQAVLRLLAAKPPKTEVILTGRNAPDSFLSLAHLVTEMKLCAHYFYSGVKAREGLDY